jgi:hypothetical protein
MFDVTTMFSNLIQLSCTYLTNAMKNNENDKTSPPLIHNLNFKGKDKNASDIVINDALEAGLYKNDFVLINIQRE